MNKFKTIFKVVGVIVALFLLIFLGDQALRTPATEADWQTHLAVQAKAEFRGDQVTVRNVRNFRYGPTEADMHPDYYDRTYNLNEITRVWYVTEPFQGQEYAAHTFLSFEFTNGDFLAITIEARKTKSQKYSPAKGMLRTYPLIYIPADERDVVLLRANLRKDNVYVYPVKLAKQENARLLLEDMLNEMNRLSEEPEWYNTLFANCTSRIAYHVNRISDNRIPNLSWRLWLTGYADELAMEYGLLDTELPLEQARQKFLINERSEAVGDTEGYSKHIRQF